VTLDGDLTVPPEATGVVLFAHGSGSSRYSPRNRFVASSLNEMGLATLLFDLLTLDEEERDAITGEFRFDIALLAERLEFATAWALHEPPLSHLPIGYFGSSTGGGAALVAAARSPHDVCTVVSRGGRPDLANALLPKVEAPTLLIVGGRDTQVIELNRAAMARMKSTVKLEIIPGATHLFEEPGTLEEVARLAGEWFVAKCSAANEMHTAHH
jgi:pimeloyl-ACP methyl ester carboxylesterase